MAIPKLLSQTWKSAVLPDDLALLQAGWRHHNPDFELVMYDDEASRELVRQVVPKFLNLYDEMPFPVMRADIFRYAVLLKNGGIYADLDMECVAPVTDDLLSSKCLLSEEAHLDPRRQIQLQYKFPVQIANCILGSEPGHPFFELILHEAFRLFEQNKKTTLDLVEDITGPKMLTRSLYACSLEDISISAQIILMAPLHHPNFWPFNANVVSRHRTMGSWKRAAKLKSIKQKWIERNREVSLFPQPRLKTFVPTIKRAEVINPS